ncbi:Uncharacterised protein [Mycobacteroides abscessus subsp. massiliense]|uniref:hypothetical protein n=1 Tax=Mycobacteroides abscessus TaxID=36809 RepID=UPI0009A6DBF6|nr:hypothetical protein [Mycobacteroides abscessus]SKU71398.1 Uncharacterised protein [Mycobacteroides abscessus subsp. massiliense]SKV03983.1 Uncharacterised protein [Mycobacteroides abscessus subsp. massiliense]
MSVRDNFLEEYEHQRLYGKSLVRIALDLGLTPYNLDMRLRRYEADGIAFTWPTDREVPQDMRRKQMTYRSTDEILRIAARYRELIESGVLVREVCARLGLRDSQLRGVLRAARRIESRRAAA